MKNLVANFSNQLQEALNIAQQAKISTPKKIDNILITGLGGSGIGGTVIAELAVKLSIVPITISKDYFIPSQI